MNIKIPISERERGLAGAARSLVRRWQRLIQRTLEFPRRLHTRVMRVSGQAKKKKGMNRMMLLPLLTLNLHFVLGITFGRHAPPPPQCCNARCNNCMAPSEKPFCTKSQANCEDKCNSHWCPGGGPPPPPPGPGPPPSPPGSSAFTINTTEVTNVVLEVCFVRLGSGLGGVGCSGVLVLASQLSLPLSFTTPSSRWEVKGSEVCDGWSLLTPSSRWEVKGSEVWDGWSLFNRFL
jgi:hypothetical protein